MKTLEKINTSYHLSKILILTSIFSIPFYQIRIPLLTTSVSILTATLFLLCIFLFFIHIKTLHTAHRQNRFFFILLTLFISSFLPSLFLWPEIHSIGVFIEWIALPTLAGLLLYVHLLHDTSSQKIVLIGLSTIFLLVSCTSLFFLLNDNVTYDNRLHGLFLSPNHLAMFLAPLFFISIAHLYLEKKTIIRSAIITSLIIGFVIITYTQSLSTFIAIGLTLIVCIFLTCKNKRLLLSLIMFILLILTIFIYQKAQNSDHVFERNSVSSRIMIWNSSIYAIQKSPMLGYPLDDFQNTYLKNQIFFEPYLEWAVPTPHNIILNFWLSGGIFSVFIFCTISSYILFRGLTIFHKQKKHVMLFLLGSFFVIILNGIFDTPYWKNDLAIIYWIITALIMSFDPPPKPTTE